MQGDLPTPNKDCKYAIESAIRMLQPPSMYINVCGVHRGIACHGFVLLEVSQEKMLKTGGDTRMSREAIAAEPGTAGHSRDIEGLLCFNKS